MPYYKDLNVVLIEIPKSGSRTLVAAAATAKVNKHLHGHKQASAIISRCSVRPDTTFMAVIRDPVDRLISSTNYQFAAAFERGDFVTVQQIYELWRRPLESRAQTIMTTQSSWLEGAEDYQKKLFRFEDIDEAVRFLGYDGSDGYIHKNKGPGRLSKETLMSLPMFDEIMAYYADDVALYNSIKKGGMNTPLKDQDRYTLSGSNIISIQKLFARVFLYAMVRKTSRRS